MSGGAGDRERGFQAGVGNTVRVSRASVQDAAEVSDVPSLADPAVQPVATDLLVVLVSDDNFSAGPVTRVYTLAVRLRP